MHIGLILVVTKKLKKIHRLEAKILAHEVGKYEKVRSRSQSPRAFWSAPRHGALE